ncbi:hypothetical protein Tco_1531601 [Tanacetum coccineum]
MMLTISPEVSEGWMKDYMDARNNVYVPQATVMVWFFLADARLRSGLPRVCWLKQREIYLVWRSSGIRVALEGSGLDIATADVDVQEAEKQMMLFRNMKLSLEAGIVTGALVKGGSRSEVPAQVEGAAYRYLLIVILR